jgi:tetratricopeptide (TPR) repeat protein
MPERPALDLAQKFVMDDLNGARIHGSRLYSILESVEAGRNVTDHQIAFLQTKGLHALVGLISGSLDRGEFLEFAVVEQGVQIAEAEKKVALAAALAAAREAEDTARNDAMMAARDNDPKLRRQREDRALRDLFGVGFIERGDFGRVMRILRVLKDTKAIAEDDLIWLQTQGQNYWTGEVRATYFHGLAEARTEEWREKGNPWDAVAASGLWRKAGLPDRAVLVTDEALGHGNIRKPLPALLTTRGGAMRDLGRYDEAKSLGLQAQDLNPRDFQPCTLLGAVHIQTHDFDAGFAWYEKAELLGARKSDVDRDLQSIIWTLEHGARSRLAKTLLDRDAERFHWAGKAK